MRSLVFAICVLVTSVANALPSWVVPSPLGVVLTVGEWIYSQEARDDVFYIRVQGQGASEDQARAQGFYLAINEAIGSLLVSETQLLNQELIKHEIVNYSSGYVHNFEYVNVYRGVDTTVILMDVWVAKSQIANRLTLPNSSDGSIDGQRLSEASKSIKQEQNTGDKVLQNILNDFPSRAFNITIENIEWENHSRRDFLSLQFTTRWHDEYLVALKEAVSIMGDSIIPVIGNHDVTDSPGLSIRGVGGCWIQCWDGWVLEHHRANLIQRGIVGKHPRLLVQLIDAHNQSVYTECYAFPVSRLYKVVGENTKIYANYAEKQHLQIEVSGLQIEKLDKVNLKIVTSTCR